MVDVLLQHADPMKDEDADYDELVAEMGVGKYQWAVCLICMFCNATDAIEIMSLSYVLPKIDETISKETAGALSSAVFFGMLIGALVCGVLADQLGRRPVLLYTMILNAVFTACFALFDNEHMMILFRFLTGFGVGGCVPVIFTLVIEVVPMQWRGRAVTIVAIGWMVGSITVAVMAWGIIPLLGWRAFALACSVPAGLCALMVWIAVLESPRLLLVQGRAEDAAQTVERMQRFNGQAQVEGGLVLRDLASNPNATGWRGLAHALISLFHPRLCLRTVLLGVVWIGICFGWYGLNTWIPTLLKKKEVHLCLDKSDAENCLYQSALVVALAAAPGNALALAIVDSVGRNKVLPASLLLSTLSALGASWVGTPGLVGLMFCLFNGLSVMAWNVLDALSSELFPTFLRAIALGFLSSLGRIAAAAAQPAFAVLSEEHSLWLSALFLFLASLASCCLPNLNSTRLDDL